MKVAILATGPSLTQAQADSVRGMTVIAVSDAYRLAPWADALVSADAAWWKHHSPEFKGKRYAAADVKGVKKFTAPTGSNSGVLAINVAKSLGATEIYLFGYDGHGTHFFGEHPHPLKNTNEPRRQVHYRQHQAEAKACAAAGIKVINCSPGTKLDCYTVGELPC